MYALAEHCPHTEPDTSSGTDAAWKAWDEWVDDHPEAQGEGINHICLAMPLEDEPA